MNGCVEVYLILSNTTKNNNFGRIIRSASAFNVTEIIVVGSEKYGTHGSHRSHKFIIIKTVSSFLEAKKYVHSKGCEIYGVDLTANQPICDYSKLHYNGSSAFVIANQGEYLSDEQKSICENYIYLRKYTENSYSFVSLDTAIITGIVLYQYAKWAKFPETKFKMSERSNGKYQIEGLKIPKLDENNSSIKAEIRRQNKELREEVLENLEFLADVFE